MSKFMYQNNIVIENLAYKLYNHGINTLLRDDIDDFEKKNPLLKLEYNRSDYLQFNQSINRIIFEDAFYIGYVQDSNNFSLTTFVPILIIDFSCFEDFQFPSKAINYGGRLKIGLEEENVKFFIISSKLKTKIISILQQFILESPFLSLWDSSSNNSNSLQAPFRNCGFLIKTTFSLKIRDPIHCNNCFYQNCNKCVNKHKILEIRNAMIRKIMQQRNLPTLKELSILVMKTNSDVIILLNDQKRFYKIFEAYKFTDLRRVLLYKSIQLLE
jgi:hypothetical protein